MILLRASILQRWQPATQDNSSSTRSSTTQATCVVGRICNFVCVGRVTPPTTTHGNPLRRFARHRLSWTTSEKRSYLLWFQSDLKFSLAQSNATQLGSTRAPLLRSTSGILESYVRFSPIFWVCVQHTLVLKSLVGRNPTYPVVLTPPDPDQTRLRGL